MKIQHFRVGNFDVCEVVKLINECTEGRNVHSIFFTKESLFSGSLEIKTTAIKNCVMKVEKPFNRESKKSKYRGVSWDKSLCKWRARIMVNGKRISLGIYDNEKEAAGSYDIAVIKYKGFNNKTNFEGYVNFLDNKEDNK